MTRDLLDLLACASCRGQLTRDGTPEQPRLVCMQCGREYGLNRGRPVILPDAASDPAWEEWEHKQELGLEEYENPDPGTKAFFDGVAREFRDFAAASGTVLDVGCGIEPYPQYAPHGDDITYVGVDPLLARDPPPFPFVQGVAEALPFADGAFDWALSATSFDHFPEPERALREIRRVLRADGSFGAWLGVVDPHYLARVDAARFALPSLRGGAAAVHELVRSGQVRRVLALGWQHGVANRVAQVRAAYQRRRHPDERIAGEFAGRLEQHFHFYREEEFVDLLERNGFAVERSRRLPDEAHGDSLFVVARPAAEA